MQSISPLDQPLVIFDAWTAVEFVRIEVLQSNRESLIFPKDACLEPGAPDFIGMDRITNCCSSVPGCLRKRLGLPLT